MLVELLEEFELLLLFVEFVELLVVLFELLVLVVFVVFNPPTLIKLLGPVPFVPLVAFPVMFLTPPVLLLALSMAY